MGIKGIQSISGAELTDDCEILNVSTIYGDKTVAYKDAMLERCHVCKGKEHMIYDEIIGESKDTKDADRFAEVEKIEKMSRKSVSHFSRRSSVNVSAVMHAVMHVQPAAVVNVYSTAPSLTVRRRQMWIPLKKKCSTLSVHSTLQEDVQTAVSAAVSAAGNSSSPVNP